LSQIFRGFLEGFWGVFAGFLAGFWLGVFWPLGIFGTQKICLGSFCVLEKILWANLCSRKFFFGRFVFSKNFFLAVLEEGKIFFSPLYTR